MGRFRLGEKDLIFQNITLIALEWRINRRRWRRRFARL